MINFNDIYIGIEIYKFVLYILGINICKFSSKLTFTRIFIYHNKDLCATPAIFMDLIFDVYHHIVCSY